MLHHALVVNTNLAVVAIARMGEGGGGDGGDPGPGATTRDALSPVDATPEPDASAAKEGGGVGTTPRWAAIAFPPPGIFTTQSDMRPASIRESPHFSCLMVEASAWVLVDDFDPQDAICEPPHADHVSLASG